MFFVLSMTLKLSIWAIKFFRNAVILKYSPPDIPGFSTHVFGTLQGIAAAFPVFVRAIYDSRLDYVGATALLAGLITILAPLP